MKMARRASKETSVASRRSASKTRSSHKKDRSRRSSSSRSRSVARKAKPVLKKHSPRTRSRASKDESESSGNESSHEIVKTTRKTKKDNKAGRKRPRPEAKTNGHAHEEANALSTCDSKTSSTGYHSSPESPKIPRLDEPQGSPRESSVESSLSISKNGEEENLAPAPVVPTVVQNEEVLSGEPPDTNSNGSPDALRCDDNEEAIEEEAIEEDEEEEVENEDEENEEAVPMSVFRSTETIEDCTNGAYEKQKQLKYVSVMFKHMGDVIDPAIKTLAAVTKDNQQPELVEHLCDQRCARPQIPYNVPMNKLNKFLKPYHHGFTRLIVKSEKGHLIVVYRTPCNKVLGNRREVNNCITALGIRGLHPSDFTFSPKLEFVETRRPVYRFIEDISYGLEARPIPFFNCYDTVDLPKLKGVYSLWNCYDESMMKYKPRFQLGPNRPIDQCSCEGESCADETKNTCFCFSRHQSMGAKMTTEDEKMREKIAEGNDQELLADFDERFTPRSAPYDFQTLPYVEDAGICECGPSCKCSRNCPLRCVSNGLDVNIAIVRIFDKGFGVVARQFIPRGTFVGTYAGVWYDTSKLPKRLKNSSYSLMVPYQNSTYDFSRKLAKLKPLPLFTLNNEETGNYGRYFNHSCIPNMFIQKVYLHNDDSRLPTIAFFTSRDVNFMEELCWDYNSDEMLNKFHCTCGHVFCKGIPKGMPLGPRQALAKRDLDNVDTDDEMAEYDDSPQLNSTRAQLVKLISLMKEEMKRISPSNDDSQEVHSDDNEDHSFEETESVPSISDLLDQLALIDCKLYKRPNSDYHLIRGSLKFPEVRDIFMQMFTNAERKYKLSAKLAFQRNWRNLIKPFASRFEIRAKDMVVFDVITFFRDVVSKRPGLSFFGNVRDEVYYYVFGNLYNLSWISHYLSPMPRKESLPFGHLLGDFKDDHIGDTFETVAEANVGKFKRMKIVFARISMLMQEEGFAFDRQTFKLAQQEYRETLVLRALRAACNNQSVPSVDPE